MNDLRASGIQWLGKILLGVSFLLGIVLAFDATAAVLATVNKKAITDVDLKQALSGFPLAQRDKVNKDLSQKRKAVQSLIQQELLVQEAQKEHLDQSNQFKIALKTYKKQLLANLLIEKKLAPQMTPGKLKAYYKKNKIWYSTDTVHAQHILLESKKEALRILKKVKKGADFMKLAETNSKDPSAVNNRGDLGYFKRTDMLRPFSEAAFRTAPGKVVGPVETIYGYHIIKVIDRRVGKPLDFSEVELRVQADLRNQLLDQYVQSLKSKAKVKIQM